MTKNSKMVISDLVGDDFSWIYALEGIGERRIRDEWTKRYDGYGASFFKLENDLTYTDRSSPLVLPRTNTLQTKPQDKLVAIRNTNDARSRVDPFKMCAKGWFRSCALTFEANIPLVGNALYLGLEAYPAGDAHAFTLGLESNVWRLIANNAPYAAKLSGDLTDGDGPGTGLVTATMTRYCLMYNHPVLALYQVGGGGGGAPTQLVNSIFLDGSEQWVRPAWASPSTSTGIACDLGLWQCVTQEPKPMIGRVVDYITTTNSYVYKYMYEVAFKELTMFIASTANDVHVKIDGYDGTGYNQSLMAETTITASATPTQTWTDEEWPVIRIGYKSAVADAHGEISVKGMVSK